VRDPRLEAQGGVERDVLRAAGETAVPPAPQLDLARQGDQPARGPAVGLEPSPTGGAPVRDGERRLQPGHQLAPQAHPDVGQRGAHGPVQRADVGMLGGQVDFDRNRTLHDEPLHVLMSDNTSSVWMGLTSFRLGQHRRWDAYLPEPSPIAVRTSVR
jgi:hypothetical protein